MVLPKIVAMKKLILVSGPAGIGKSTFCRNYQSEHPDEEVHVVAADEVRKEMFGGYDKFPQGKNMMVIYEKMIEKSTALLFEGKPNITVMIDTTMLYDERRTYFLRNIRGYEWSALYLLKVKDLNTVLARNRSRQPDKVVPENVVIDMHKKYMDPSDEVIRLFDEFKYIYVD